MPSTLHSPPSGLCPITSTHYLFLLLLLRHRPALQGFMESSHVEAVVNKLEVLSVSRSCMQRQLAGAFPLLGGLEPLLATFRERFGNILT